MPELLPEVAHFTEATKRKIHEVYGYTCTVCLHHHKAGLHALSNGCGGPVPGKYLLQSLLHAVPMLNSTG
jgi:hypothetical protein